VYNLNPTPFPWETSFGKIGVLGQFSKLSSKSQDQVQSHLGDIPVGLRS